MNDQPRFAPGELPAVKKMFWDSFGVSIGQFIDNVLTASFAYVVIDIISFDAWLVSLHGDYMCEGLSMNQLVALKYGTGALELLNKIS